MKKWIELIAFVLISIGTTGLLFNELFPLAKLPVTLFLAACNILGLLLWLFTKIIS